MIREKVIKLLAEYLGKKPEDVDDNSRLIEDLGIDSLATLELVMRFEEEFGMEIDDKDAYQMKVVKDIYKFISDKIKTS